MKKTVWALAIISPFIFHLSPCQAQYNESVVVKGSYTPVIEQAEKLNFPAQVSDTLSRIEHAFHYSITPTRLRAMYEPTRIRAARITTTSVSAWVTIGALWPTSIGVPRATA